MAEAPLQQQQQQEVEEEEEVAAEQLKPSAEEVTETNEGPEEPKEEVQTTPTRPLLSMRSMSSVDPENDSPNMIIYRKVKDLNDTASPVSKLWIGENHCVFSLCDFVALVAKR